MKIYEIRFRCDKTLKNLADELHRKILPEFKRSNFYERIFFKAVAELSKKIIEKDLREVRINLTQ